MQDVLIDVRCLQEPGHEGHDAGRHAAALVSRARATLRGDRLIGLIDPALPAVPGWLGTALDELRVGAYPGGLTRPARFVQLSPWSHDPLFVAPLLEHPRVASAVALHAPDPVGSIAGRIDRAVATYWLPRYDLFLPVSGDIVCPGPAVVTGAAWRDATAAPLFWSATAGLAGASAPALVTGRRPRVALLTPEPDLDLCDALGRIVELHHLTEPGAWVQAGGRFDRVLSVIANTARHAPMIEAVARHGGDCVLLEPCLLEAYRAGLGYKRTASVAEAELGRALGPNELEHWLAQEVRPGPLFLSEICRGAARIVVHSRVLADELSRRYGPAATVLPMAVGGARPARTGATQTGAIRIVAFASGVMAASCIGALGLLRAWGTPARLDLVADGAELGWLRSWLELEDRLAFVPAAAGNVWASEADVALYLTMRGHGSLAAGLARSAAGGVPCVASQSVAEAVDAPPWVRTIPDPPSPVLIAEAVLDALAAAPTEAARHGWAGATGPADYARRLCATLELG